jgi:hypothetical protein
MDVVSLEERWEQAEVERRREWAELEMRFVTAEEKRQAFDDALFLKVNAMNAQFLKVLHEINDSLQQLTLEVRMMREEMRGGFAEMRAEFAEVRAEQRAGREALLQVLDRLPPPQGAAG